MMMLMPFIPFTQHRTHQQQQAVASLAGTLAIARSPASAVCTFYVSCSSIEFNGSEYTDMMLLTVGFGPCPSAMSLC